jgi:hypothetical protein
MYEESLEQSNLRRIQEEGDIRVLEDYEEEQEAQENNMCTYCGLTF